MIKKLRSRIHALKFAAKSKKIIIETLGNLGQEAIETREMANLFFKLLGSKLNLSKRHVPPTEAEVKAAIEQLKDVGRFSIFSGVSILPGGGFSLIGLELLARKLGVKNFTFVPSAFRKKMGPLIKGILFDMDGVLVDSEEYICRAAIKMFEQKGLKVKPDDFLPFVGKGENAYIGGVAEKYNFPVDIDEVKKITYDIYAKLVEGKLNALPGVFEFIEKAKSKGLKLAVATSADKVKMEVNLKNIGLNSEKFDATVNGLEVENKKPHPDIFLHAANKLGLLPEFCLVVEDAVSGVEAAKAAGSKCLALTTSFKKNELEKADWISNTLEDAPDECLEW